jgi:hypothetical protein
LINENPEEILKVNIKLALLGIERPSRCLSLMKIYHSIEKMACLSLSTKDTDYFNRVRRSE